MRRLILFPYTDPFPLGQLPMASIRYSDFEDGPQCYRVYGNPYIFSFLFEKLMVLL